MRRWVGLAAWAVVLSVSAIGYARADALDHFMVHLVYGASAGVAAGAVATRFWRWPRALPASVWALAGYAFMVVPDILWLLPQLVGRAAWEHEGWMDVFLGHVFLDAWPGTRIVILPIAALGTAAWWALRRTTEGSGDAAKTARRGSEEG